MPPERAVPVVLNVIEPVCRLDDRRAFTGDRISETRAVLRLAIEDLLRRKLTLLRLPGLRFKFRLDPFPPGRWGNSIFALESPVECGFAAETHCVRHFRRILP